MEYLLVVASTYIKCDTENYIKEVKLYSIPYSSKSRNAEFFIALTK